MENLMRQVRLKVSSKYTVIDYAEN